MEELIHKEFPFSLEAVISRETLLAGCLLVLVAVNSATRRITNPCTASLLPCDKIEENGTESGTIATPKVRNAGNAELGLVVILMPVGMV